MHKTQQFIKSNLPLLVGVITLAIGVALFKGGEGQIAEAQAITAPKKTAVLVESFQLGDSINAYTLKTNGRLRAQNILSVVSEIAGKVTYVNPLFKTGGHMNKGAILLKVNATAYETDVIKSKAALANSYAQLVRVQSDYTRARKLFKNGNSSQSSVDAAKANLKAAEMTVEQNKAQLRLANEVLSRTNITSPFDAIVIDEQVSVATYVSPGQILATLMDSNKGEIAISLQKDQITALARTYAQNGEKPIPVVALPGDGAVGSRSIKGFITRISPVIDTRSRTAVIIAEFENVFVKNSDGLIFGDDYMSVEIKATSDTPLWQIPYGAVRRNNYIWLITKDNTLKKQAVTVMASVNSDAVVHSTFPLTGQHILMTLLPEEIEGKLVRISPTNRK